MDLGLAGRACAVTGASRGIGRETARMLCAEGASVLLVARGAERARRGGRGVPRGGGRRGGRRGAGARRHRAPTPASGSSSECERALRQARRARQQRRHRALARARRRPRGGLVRGLGAERDGAAAADARRRSRRWSSAAGAGWSTSPRAPASGPRRRMPEYSVAKAAELSLSRLFADRHAARRRARQRDLPRADEVGAVDGRGRAAGPVPARSPATRTASRRSRPPARAGRSAASPRARRSPRRSSSSAPSAPPTSPAPPGRSTAARCR